MAVDYFRHVGEVVAVQFDRTDDAWGERECQVAVAVSAHPYAPVESYLWDRGFRRAAPFYDLVETSGADHPLRNGWVASLDDEDCRQVRRVFGHLGDERSRANYLSFLGWRAAREEWNFAGVPYATVEDRYFIPEVVAALRGDEILLDGGAYDGEVSKKFLSLTRGTFSQVVAAELDPENFVKRDDDFRIEYLRTALSDRDGVEKFYGGFGLASRLDDRGGAFTQTRKIDSLGVRPTFVKLHLEGGELAALRGGEETLARCRPVVAATTYHSEDGVWRILGWMVDHLEDYKFLWRNHGWCGTGAVAYAIPRERC